MRTDQGASTRVALIALLALAGGVSAARGQSLFHAPLAPPLPAPAPQQSPSVTPSEPAGDSGQPDKPAPAQPAPAPAPMPAARPTLTLADTGLYVVQPVKPRVFVKHDKVQVIVNEITTSKLEQKLDTKEDASLAAELAQFPSLRALLRDGVLANGVGSEIPKVGVKNGSSYKGQGTAERKDRLSARVSGLVVEVKPNGMMLVEARQTIIQDAETKTLVLSGLCDPKEVTTQGTIESSQLANLVIRVEHSGDLKDATVKHPITKFFEAIFGP